MDKNQIVRELSSAPTKEAVEQRYQTYLGKKGSITLAFKTMGDLTPEERKEKGLFLSDLKTSLEAAYAEKEQSFAMAGINELLNKELIDISLPGKAVEQGYYNLLVKTRREMEDIAQSMGFIVELGTEVVSKFENFEAVNIPISHPATEMHDTIYLKQKDARGENFVLRTHTSSAQNYIIRKHGVPIKAVLP
jgi:phenylalanyl-tRNA synthetase alpha chain